MPEAKVGEIKIYYEIHGKGEPLVIIPGLAGTLAYYFRLIPGLAEKYRVIALDHRGSGLSDKPDITYSIQMMADDVVGLLNVLGVDKAHVFGHTLGGMIAQHIALRYPENTISLILVCTSCGGKHALPPDQEYIALIADMHRRSQQTREETIREQLPFLFSQEFIDNSPDLIEYFISLYITYSPPLHGYIRQMEAIFTHDTYDLLDAIKIPTLVIAGGADRLQPVENSRVLASRIPNAELKIMEGMSHFLGIEGAESLNKVILDFLRLHPKSA